MRITKVYTRTGDKGSTSLADGTRVPKSDARIETYGTVDELNSVIGLCLEGLSGGSFQIAEGVNLDSVLASIQHDLFNIGGDLATPVDKRFAGMVLVSDLEVGLLEKLMDAMSQELPPLKDFILPAGSALCAYLHLARTVCRRAERLVARLSEEVEINPSVLIYMNRLSDFFFVAARFAQFKQSVPEVTWSKAGGLARLASILKHPSNGSETEV